uniref:Desmoplakin b n=1 Tax=Amphiprion ocellaris TaxID=80972 RepID=A0AAQ6AAK2_AMPOC
MSMYGSQQGLNMGRRVSSKGDLAGGGSYHYARSEVVHGGGNGYDPYMDGYKTYTFSKSTGMGGGMGSGTMSGVMSQMASGMEGGTMTRMSGSAFGAINQRAEALQSQCNEYLKKADYAMQAGSGDTEYYMGKAKDAIEKLKYCAMDLRQMGQPNDNVIRSLEICKDRLKGAHMAMTSSMQRRRSTRGSSGGWEDPGRSFHDAMAWIGQHKRLIETALWGDDPAAIEQQLTNHQRFHTSIQRSPEMDRARDELAKKGDKGSLHALEQEWDSLQQMSFGRTQQLQDLMYLIQEISREIMWVNDREEEELMFDWGDKNVDQYIPKKQESYSKLMSALEDKEMELNKLKAKVDNVLKNNHPAADKIEAYKDTLQTQWSWLLQITKCIDVHLKENGAYSQFFKEANDTYSALQKEHETVRKNYPCDKSTSLENLLELLRGLEREKEKIMENKRQVQHLVNRSKSIVRLKPRNPEEKSNHSVIVKALCDFKQDQKVICKDNEAILKDNSQRSKWQVTGPGGLDMLVPSVCLIVPPPNPLSISLANKNEQYYEAILSIWNQLYINVKSLIAWQYCLLDIRRINSLTINMLAKMRPEEYRQIIKSLETHYEEFKLSSHGSQMFADEDKRSIENQFTGAQAHYDQLVVQLPTYGQYLWKSSDRNQAVYVARAEDIVKVHEARLTEKETTSLSPGEVDEYMLTLKNVKAELDQKKDVLASMEKELAKASHWNSQLGDPFHRCDMMLSKYTEQVGVLSDRWRRIQGQIDTRLQDLKMYVPQLQHYNLFTALTWLYVHACLIIRCLTSMFGCFLKALNTEIKAKRETVERVLKDNEACVNTIKDYETDLSSYTSGLETLLNVPIKRTMLKSPSMDLNQEAIQLQTRYMELLTMSGDYHKFLGESLKNMEELKIRNTRIDLLEEELRLLREDIQDCNGRNKSLEDTVARYQLELSQSQEQLLSVEEVKRNTALQCNATKESLDSTQSQLTELSDQVTRLTYLLDEEKRKRKLAEERYNQQQEEYESVLRKRQNELETVSWSKMDVEKSVANKDHEIENLRRQLDAETARVKELNSRIKDLQAVRDGLESQMENLRIANQEEVARRRQVEAELEKTTITMTEDAELRNKQRLQEENERVKRDLSYWKDQCDSKQGMIRQYDTDKEILEREKKSLKSEIERLMRELKDLDETNKSRLSTPECYLDPETEHEASYEALKKQCKIEPHTGLLLLPITEKLDPSKLIFDGVRKPVTAQQLLDCGVLDKPTVTQLMKGEKTVPEVSEEKKIFLKGTGSIAGVAAGPSGKVSFSEAKKKMLIPPDSADLLLEAQAATGHIIDPTSNQKLTVDEACVRGVVDNKDRDKLLAAERAAVGYRDPNTAKPLSVFEAMKKGMIDRNTGVRLLQAQELAGGILDPNLSVFLPKDTAIKRNLLDEDLCHALNQDPHPACYLDPETECNASYEALKKKCKTEPHTGLLLFPVTEQLDPSKLIFDGVRKPVTAQQLLDCGVLDKPTVTQLMKGEKTIPEVSEDKKKFLKGTGSIAGVAAGPSGKMSLSEAKKKMLMPPNSADLLLEAQAATGHIIDPTSNQKLTVDEACVRGVVDKKDRDKLLAAERAAVGYRDPNTAKPLSVFEAMKKGMIDRNTGVRLLQAQELAGGILDPNLSVFLPKDTAIKRNLLDEDLCRALNKDPQCYLDPDTEQDASYGALKKRCKTEPRTGLILLPITERKDPSKLMFDGVCKPVSAQQLFDCGLLDKLTFNQLVKGEKTVPIVSMEKKAFLKGTGPIDGIVAGRQGKMSLSEAKKQSLLPVDSADLLLEAQAATGHITDPKTGQKLTVEEACAKGVVDRRDRDRLLAAQAAAIGYKDPSAAKPLSVFEAMKKGLIEKETALRLLQAQVTSGGILDPNLSVFLPKDTAIKWNLLDESLSHALNQSPACYLDPETKCNASYEALKKKCKTEPHTGLLLFPVTEQLDPSKLIFYGVRKPVTAQQLLDCGVLDKPTVTQLMKEEKTIPEVSEDKKVYLKGTGSIAGVVAGPLGKMSFSEAKKKMLMPPDSADLLLEAQAAT